MDKLQIILESDSGEQKYITFTDLNEIETLQDRITQSTLNSFLNVFYDKSGQYFNKINQVRLIKTTYTALQVTP